MRTLAQAIYTYGVDVDPHLDRSVTIPVGRFVRQGDVIVVPDDMRAAARTPVPASGVAVVRGENGGNTHLLLAAGPVFFDARTSGQLDLGTLTVADGATAYLAHPEHAYVGLEPGTYEIRRQREQADEIRLVQD